MMIAMNDQKETTMPEPERDLHVPVMATEVREFLQLKSGDIVLDATLGIGGHATRIAQAIGPSGKLIGIDRDGDSLSHAQERFKNIPVTAYLRQDDFRNLDQVLASLHIPKVNAILFDLGISSYQLNNPQRGFSLKLDGPLDMRMDKESYISAYDLVNSLSERELSSILKNFGEERWHNRIAHFLVTERARHPIESTKELTDTVLKAIPFRYQHQKIHPATRTFQAIRIAVNRELEALDIALEKAIFALEKTGRLCVIAFHSLEDRIVKKKFRGYTKEHQIKIITKKPLRPTENEVHNNPRCRSARLRVAERIS